VGQQKEIDYRQTNPCEGAAAKCPGNIDLSAERSDFFLGVVPAQQHHPE
jgi:hypothetical protein